MTFLAWQVLKNDLTSIYGQHYGPTRDENDGEAISSGGIFTKPIHVFIKRNVDSVFKIGIRPDSGTDTLNKVSIIGALGGNSGPTVGIIEDDFYVDERQAITEGVIAQFITPTVQVSDDKNYICWLAFRNLTDDIRKDYKLQIVINDTDEFDLVITNYQILDEYKTIERVYSDKPLIDKITEDVRLHTASNIDALQLGLIPYWIHDLRYEKTWIYYKDEKDEVLHDPFYNTIGIKIGNIPNNTLLNTEAPRFFNINIFSEYKIDTLRTYVRPFLMFINRIFISWDRIRMVKSDDNVFFAITGIDSEEIVTSVDILMLPDEALYVQKDGLAGWNPRADYNYLFCFTMDGRMGGMDIFIYVRDPTVKGIVYHQSQYKDEILDIKFDQKLTSNNFFVFDDDGYLCKNYDLEIKNGNVFTLNAGAVEDYRVSIILSTQSNYSNAHITQGRFNPAFAQNVIANKKMWAEFDMTKDLLMKDFDYEYDKDLSYDDNLQNAYDYTWDHNVKHYDFVPWFYRPLNRQPLDPARIISQISKKTRNDISGGEVAIERDLCFGDFAYAFAIIFVNGVLPDWYQYTRYTDSDCIIRPKGLKPEDKLEVAFFRSNTNILIPVNKQRWLEPDGSLKINVTDFSIPAQDIVLLADVKTGADRYFAMPYEWDATRDYIIHSNQTAISHSDFYIGSQNIFLYKRYDITGSDTNRLLLGDYFKAGFDLDKYMVFYNGRYVNRIYWRLLRPEFNTPEITRTCLYMMHTLHEGDRVEIFYCGLPNMRRMKFNGDLKIVALKTIAYKNNQIRFKVPYPFRNYPHIYDAFFCVRYNGRIQKSEYVDKSKYFLDGEYIEFYNVADGLNYGEELIFIFPYYRQDWEDEDDGVTDDNIIQFITVYERNGDIRVPPGPGAYDYAFGMDNSGVNYIDIPKAKVYEKLRQYTPNTEVTQEKCLLFIDTAWINPNRWTLTSVGSNYRITKTDGIPIHTGNQVNLMIAAELPNYDNSHISVTVMEVTATQPQQYVFDLPKPEEENESFFVMNGTVLFSDQRYGITTDNKLVITNVWDYIPAGEKLIFVYFRDKEMDLDPNYKWIYKVGYAYWRVPGAPQKYIPIPDYITCRVQLRDDNMLLFSDNAFINSERYQVNGNKIVKQTIPQQHITALNGTGAPVTFDNKTKEDLNYKTNYAKSLPYYIDNEDHFMTGGKKEITRYEPPKPVQWIPGWNVYGNHYSDDVESQDQNISIVYVYKTINRYRVDIENEGREIIYFTDVNSPVWYNGQNQIGIPWIVPGLEDMAYLVSINHEIISKKHYYETTDHKWIVFDNTINLNYGDDVRFTFIHNWGYTNIICEKRVIETDPASAKTRDKLKIYDEFGTLLTYHIDYEITDKNTVVWLNPGAMSGQHKLKFELLGVTKNFETELYYPERYNYGSPMLRFDVTEQPIVVPFTFDKLTNNRFSIPSPFYKKVKLNDRMIVTYQNRYLDRDRYTVDSDNLILTITDEDLLSDPLFLEGPLTFYFFHCGSEYTGSAAYLPQSGYVCMIRSDVDRHFNKEMYMMFVNGKWVHKQDLLDIANGYFKVRTDIKRRFDLVMLNAAPKIQEFPKEKFHPQDEWSDIMDKLNIN